MRGATREVLLVGRWAVKFPSARGWRLFLHGLLGNMQEALWAPHGAPDLCPVVFACPGGWVIVMARAEPAGDVYTPEMAALRARQHDIPEPKASSYGWLDGRLVAVDFG